MSSWKPEEVGKLLEVWSKYKKGLISAAQVLVEFPDRNINAISKKFWKTYGRLPHTEKEDKRFETPGLEF